MLQTLRFGERTIGYGQPCLVIPEIGVNHNGDLDTALTMIDAVADAGAECVKFQTFSAEEFMNNPDETYEYISQGETVTESMLEMFQRLELKSSDFEILFKRARDRGLIPISTGTDRVAVDLLDDLGTPAFKIGSDDLVYSPFLEYVAGKGKPVIISTGMAGASDVERAVRVIQDAGNNEIVILHCVSLYPTPEEDVNLRKIKTLQSQYGACVGYSDHSWGITAALGAVALGACIIEKHFTLDRKMPGPDHRFSSDPEELTALVREVRRLEKNLGSGRFCISSAEQEMADLCHRSIVLNCDVAAGDEITEDHLVYQRPGTGLMPYETPSVVGKRARGALASGTILDFMMLE